MATTVRSKWLRRVEHLLWLVGVSLLGVTFASAVDRHVYQAKQERAVERMMLVSESIPSTTAPAAPLTDAVAPALPSLPETADAALDSPISEPATLSEAAIDVADDEVTSELSLEGSLGMIEIPRLGLSAVVAEGDDAETLDRAVGWLPDTALPGTGGNSAFAAHRDTLFRPLEKVEVGDVVHVTIPPHKYAYRVESLDVVKPTDVSVLENRGTDELTLITCYPFRWIGPAPNRFIVRASRIE